MMNSPNDVEAEQLDELHIQIVSDWE
jgi:hypothetical protein